MLGRLLTEEFNARIPSTVEDCAMTANVSSVSLADGREVCLSYGVPVAVFIPSRGVVKTDRRYSVTTSRHANQFMRGSTHTTVPHAEFRVLVQPIVTEA